MSCQVHVGILDENGKLTKEAKENFISEVLLLLEYGTENIPADKKPPIPYTDSLGPDPSYLKYRKSDKNYLRDEKKYSAFHKNWVGRYEKLAKDLNFKPNFSLLPVIADPIAIAGSGFNAEIPSPDFPGGFAPYFGGLLPQKLIVDLVDSGETKFLSPTGPIELVKTLIEKKAPPAPTPPTIPQITPPPLPPGFALPTPDSSKSSSPALPNVGLNANFQIPPPPKKPASEVLSALSAKEFAAYANLPKALGEIVGKIPSLLGKLANPGDAIAEIAGIIKKAGVLGPEPKKAATLEKAAQAVLSSKIAEMSLVGALAITIGSSPGSVTTAITQKTSSKQPAFKYKPAPRKQPAAKKELTPAEKSYQKALGLAGTSFGNQSTRTRYLEGLFYIEASYRGYPPEYLNVYGELTKINGARPIDWATVKQKGFKASTTEEQRESTHIEKPEGFFEIQEIDAFKMSSCAMFVRSCLAAAGASNYAFLSLYPASAGLQIIQNIGLMRNYRWVSNDPDYDKNFDNPKGGRAIINDLYSLEKDEREVLTPVKRKEKTPGLKIPGVKEKGATEDLTIEKFEKLLDDFAGAESRYNKEHKAANKTELENGVNKALGRATVNFAGDWVLDIDENGNASPTKLLTFLKQYLKPREERCFFYNKDIGYMIKNPDAFPELKKGDALLIVKVDKSRKGIDWLTNGEHILLIGNDRASGFKVSNTILDPSIAGIEGGSLDDDNLKPAKTTTTYSLTNQNEATKTGIKNTVKALLNAAVGSAKGDAKKYVLLQGGITQDEADGAYKVFIGESGDPGTLAKAVGKDKLSLEGTLDVPSPTAILQAEHDLGDIVVSKIVTDNQFGPGLFLGSTNMARTKQILNAQSAKNLQAIKTTPAERRIIGIFKTDNYCNKIENNSPLATIAMIYMDDIIVNNTSNYFRQTPTIEFFASRVFPGRIPKVKEKTTHADAVGATPPAPK